MHYYSFVMLLLLRDFTKFIIENKDSQAYVNENMVSNAVARFFRQASFFAKLFQVLNTSFFAFLFVTPISNFSFSNTFQVNSKVNKFLLPN